MVLELEGPTEAAVSVAVGKMLSKYTVLNTLTQTNVACTNVTVHHNVLN